MQLLCKLFSLDFLSVVCCYQVVRSNEHESEHAHLRHDISLLYCSRVLFEVSTHITSEKIDVISAIASSATCRCVVPYSIMQFSRNVSRTGFSFDTAWTTMIKINH